MEDTKQESPRASGPNATSPPPILMMIFWMLLGGIAWAVWLFLGARGALTASGMQPLAGC